VWSTNQINEIYATAKWVSCNTESELIQTALRKLKSFSLSSALFLIYITNFQVVQRYQNKVLKSIVNAPRYVRNSDLHRTLRIETVTDIIAKFANCHERRLQDHINIKASRLLNVNNMTRRLKRKKPFELVRL
jgi:hypothetical protein